MLMFMKFINNFMCACAMLKWFDLVVYFLELKYILNNSWIAQLT